jgi:hypothetical protein
VAKLAMQVECLLAELQRLGVLTEVSVAPADSVQRPDLPGRVANGAAEVQRPRCVLDSVAVATLALKHPRDVEARASLSHPVPGLAERLDRAPEMLSGPGGRAGADVKATQLPVRVSLPRYIACSPRRIERRPLRGRQLGPAALPL